MIKGSDLENREVNLSPRLIEEHAPRGREAVDAAIREMKARPPAFTVDALAHLRQRIEQARSLVPARDAHCGCCYGRGRDEAIATIEGA